MSRAELELKVPVFERANMVHASDRATTVIGPNTLRYSILIVTF
jgi:hypothetical protein